MKVYGEGDCRVRHPLMLKTQVGLATGVEQALVHATLRFTS